MTALIVMENRSAFVFDHVRGKFDDGQAPPQHTMPRRIESLAYLLHYVGHYVGH
jgi:hypothetical protein